MRLPTFYEQNLIPNWGNTCKTMVLGRIFVFLPMKWKHKHIIQALP